MNSNLHFYHIALNFIIMKMFQTEVVEKIEKNSTTIFEKNYSSWKNVKKFCRLGRTPDCSMAHVHYTLDN
jgi:hypothetical protein